MLSVRPYTPADAAATIAIFLGAIRDVASRNYGPAEIDAWARVEDVDGWARARASRPTFVAERGGVPVGFSDLEPDGHLDMMFVHPNHQGIGVASVLLAAVEAEAGRLGLDRIFTDASLTARPFFECRGFVVLAAQQVERRGVTIANFRMEKLLVRRTNDPSAC